MNTYEKLKKKLIQLNSDFVKLFQNAETFSGISLNNYNEYEKACNTISRQLSEDIVRVAVVGPIKSGKSTFVNSLFRSDYLKRGAGVITSIVTKIRCGEKLKATISFKSWDEINTDIEHGLTLLPIEKSESEETRFDLRKESHRQKLQKAMDSLKAEQLIIDDSRNLNSVLLSSYLKGYDRVKDIISPDSVTIIHEDEDFSKHRVYTGDEIMAVFINDIRLEINSNAWGQSIEIADCQGSDSPNPLHLAMVQDYLSVTNLIVYVISSRTGLRRADIKFLSMIKEMGIMDNMMFVINCDFSEHESMDEFNTLMAKIKEELSFIVPDPEIFTLSALYNLFNAKKESNRLSDRLSEKDISRLEQWEKEKEFSDLSVQEGKAFEYRLNKRLTENRYALMLTNHIERLSLMASGISQKASVHRNIMNRDSSEAKEIINRIKGNQDKTSKVSAMIKSTLDGAVKKVNSDLEREVDIFFDEKSGTAISDIKKFIRNYENTFTPDIQSTETSGFSGNLYIVFQDFKQAVDSYITETITPKIMGFTKHNEKKIIEDLCQMTKPYANMVENALTEYSSVLDDFGINIDISEKNSGQALPDIESLKSLSHISNPKVSPLISYTARVKAESVLRFSVYRIISVINSIFKKHARNKAENETIALKDGLSRIKYETASNLVSHFTSYKETLKSQYFFKLTDIIANSIYNIHTNNFNAYISDLETVSTLINEKKNYKEKIIHELELFEKNIIEISEKISMLKSDISFISKHQQTLLD